MATSFSIVKNIGALNALNRLTQSNAGLSKTLERPSSGLRINSAADGLRDDVAALNQAVRTAIDA